MKFNINIRGMDRLRAKLASRISGDEVYQRAVAGALFEEATTIIEEAKELTPVDTGALRASGHVQLPVVSRERVTVVAGFGGVAGSGMNPVGYAVHVHENLTAHHPVGQAKFLEVPLNKHRPGMSKSIADRVRKRLGPSS